MATHLQAAHPPIGLRQHVGPLMVAAVVTAIVLWPPHTADAQIMGSTTTSEAPVTTEPPATTAPPTTAADRPTTSSPPPQGTSPPATSPPTTRVSASTTTTLRTGVPDTVPPGFTPPAGVPNATTTVPTPVGLSEPRGTGVAWALWLFIIGTVGAVSMMAARWWQTRP